LEREDEDLLKVYGYRFQDRYQFVTQSFPMFGNGGAAFEVEDRSRVLLARVIPFKDFQSQGVVFRTFVYQDSKGRVGAATVLEERVQRLFKMYGVTIPVPPGLPAIETNVPRTKPHVSGQLPDSGDAKRVWPDAPKSSGTSGSPSSERVSIAVGPTQASGRSWQAYLWAGFATIVAGAAGWIFLRSRGKTGQK
jgi:hypothetical protein